MLRFVASVWNSESEWQELQARRVQGAVLSRARWGKVLDAPGVVVMCRGLRARSAECYELKRNAGVVLGKMFSRGGESGAAFHVTDDVSTAIVRSGGRYLVKHCWGQYVGFIRDERKSVFVLQCPSAGRPLYTTTSAASIATFPSLPTLWGALMSDSISTGSISPRVW